MIFKFIDIYLASKVSLKLSTLFAHQVFYIAVNSIHGRFGQFCKLLIDMVNKSRLKGEFMCLLFYNSK